MRRILKNNLAAGILVLIIVSLGIVFAGDVIVKEGTLESADVSATNIIRGEKFASTDCTAVGTRAVAFGEQTIALGDWSTATGYTTVANGDCSTAMGYNTTASGDESTAMGESAWASGYRSTAMGNSTIAGGVNSTAMGGWTTASGNFSTAMGACTTTSGLCSTAMGYNFTNNVQNSFAVGFGQKDFSVVSGLVTAYGNLYVNGWISGQDVIDRSSFYDKDKYGRALDHLQDSSATIKVNAQGERAYNHDADPEFIRRIITIPDYDKYTEEQVWDNELNCMVTRRNYQTRQELGSSSSAKMAWLTQCVYELKQENEGLKAEVAAIKAKLGME
jgi:hypothetical protein